MQSVFNTFAASASENCDGKDCETVYPEVAKKYIYWMAAMQFLNALLPGIYYAAMRGYSRRSYEDDEDDFALLTREQENKIPRVSDGEGRRRNWAWGILMAVHTTVWGPGIILFILSFFKSLANWYRFYIEHILSNLNYLTYFTGIILLTVSAMSNGLQGWLELAIYAFLFAGAFYFVELIMGVKSMQALDRKYKYDDHLLLPSLFYVLGMKHVLRVDPDTQIEEESTDPFGFENDPSSDADIPIEFFSF